MPARNKRKNTEVICQQCGKSFLKENYELTRFPNHFCSHRCFHDYDSETNTIITNCAFCGEIVKRYKNQVNKSISGNVYCSRNCSASFSNKERKRVRRSKIEASFFEQLCQLFPNLNILPNDKQMLDGLEVDIAIPELKLAIEWNGIVHFKPIYGDNKLHKVRTKDARKIQLSNDKNINLIVIADLDSSKSTLKKAIDEVKIIIDDLLDESKLSNCTPIIS